MKQNEAELAGVAVLGAGVVNPVASTLDDFAKALDAARPRLSRLEGVPVPRGKSLVGLVKEAAFEGSDKAFRMAASAIDQALAASGIDLAAMGEVGVVLATMAGESHAAEKCYTDLAALERVDDSIASAVGAYPNGVLLQRLCSRFGFIGPRFVVSNACASGNIAIGLALDFLRTGKCKAMVVVGVEVIKPSMVWGAERAGFVGNRLAPFHPERDGAILGEGAAALVLVEPALASGASVLGWVDGFGSVCDRGAAPITLAEDGSGLYRAMQLALDDAARSCDQLEYVNAHAPGTRMIDAIECGAVARLRGGNGDLYVNSTKSITSHLSGAAAITEVIATLVQMRDSFVHGNAGLDCHDPALALRPVGATTLRRQFDFGLSNACGGGGLNTSIALSSARSSMRRRLALQPTSSTPLVITGSAVVAAANFHWRGHHEQGTRPAAHLCDFDVYRYYPVESNYHYMNRAAQLAAAVGAAALAEAGIAPQALPYPDDRFAVIFGSCLGGSPQASKVLCDGLLKNPNAITPSMALDHGIHLGAALVCRHYGLTGTTYTLTGSRRSGLQALEVAALSIQTRRAEAALIAGYDAYDAFEAAVTEQLALAPEPADAAGAVVLETADRAESRHAPVQAWLTDVRTLSGVSEAASGRERLSDRLGRYLAVQRWDALYLATHTPACHQQLIERALDLAGRPHAYLTLGEDIPDPRAGLGMMAIADAIRRGVPAAIVAPGDDGTALVAIVSPMAPGSWQ
ncbi:MAG TPA: beta-ketoacyl synthase N-terminal-like domain-containing protein [Noviherbaspirillum sp.]